MREDADMPMDTQDRAMLVMAITQYLFSWVWSPKPSPTTFRIVMGILFRHNTNNRMNFSDNVMWEGEDRLRVEEDSGGLVGVGEDRDCTRTTFTGEGMIWAGDV